MFIYLAAMSVVAISCHEELSLNQRIKNDKESWIEYGTEREAEEAKKWGNRVYLATYPRSGNHWTRYLIEEATGIATSSVYRDYATSIAFGDSVLLHLENVFPWGGYCCENGYEGDARYPTEGEIAIVKTHFPTMHISRFEKLPYSRAIHIVRHPVDSFYSLYHWGKINENATVEWLVPREDLKNYIRSWRRFQEYWNSAENTLTIRYEDLYRYPISYLKCILESIGYEVSQEDIERAVAKHPPSGGVLKHLSHFTDEDLSIIQSELGDLMEVYGYKLKEIDPL